MFFDNEDIFAHPEKFLKCLDQLSDVQGYVQHTVLEIELQRERIRKPQSLFEEAKPEGNKVPTPVIVQTAQPVQSSPGMFGYLSERLRARVLEKQLEKGNASPTITTTQKPRDILDYCRDITREYNKIVDYFQCCLDTLTLFPNTKKTRDFYYAEIRSYVNKLSNIIKSFSRAITEYRKELVGERQESYARAITSLEEARYMAQLQGSQGPNVDRMFVEMMKEKAARAGA
jgi:hypothetical protein